MKLKQKQNKIKNTSLFRFGVCGVVMLLIVCEFVVDGMIASFSVAVDVEFVDVSDSFDFCNAFAELLLPLPPLFGYFGGIFVTPTKLSGTSTAISRCGPKSYSGGPISPPDDELRVLSEPRDFVR